MYISVKLFCGNCESHFHLHAFKFLNICPDMVEDNFVTVICKLYKQLDWVKHLLNRIIERLT